MSAYDPKRTFENSFHKQACTGAQRFMFAAQGVKQRGGIRPFLSNVSHPAIAVFKTNDVILVEGFVEMGSCDFAPDHPVLCHLLLAF